MAIEKDKEYYLRFMQERTYLSAPHMGENELKYIHEAFETNWVAPIGPNINTFERKLEQYSGMAHAAALTSGTAAIHLALLLLNVKRGDTVICSTFTFAGSCNPIVYVGGEPVFVDSEADTWNMDPELLEQAIVDLDKRGKKPKAVILVHLYGMPAKIDEILAVTNKYEIPVIEDAAEALGSMYKGKPLGSFGTFGIYSFNGNKIITTSGGGALLSNNAGQIEKAKFLATQARDPAVHYEHSEIGYNYRLSNISAGIGCGQMEVLQDRVASRREIYAHYASGLSEVDSLTFVDEMPQMFSNRWLTTLLIDENCGVQPEDIRRLLEEHNIESRPLWKPMHLQPVFSEAEKYLNGVSVSLFARGLCLPSGSAIPLKRIDEIIELIAGNF